MKKELKNILLILLVISTPFAYSMDLNKWMNTIDKTGKSTSPYKKINEKLSLVFVYSSKCNYCRKFAPTLNEFITETGIKVESITADGGLLNGFKDAIYSPELITSLNVKAYPTVFAINNNTSQLLLLGQGNLSKTELYENYDYLQKHITRGEQIK